MTLIGIRVSMPMFSYISVDKHKQDGNRDNLRSIWKGYGGHADNTEYLHEALVSSC